MKCNDLISVRLLERLYDSNQIIHAYNNEDIVSEEIQLKWKKKREEMENESKRSVCRSCGTMNGKKKKLLNKCGGCGCTFYCCSDCQKLDWVHGHKNICKKLKKDKWTAEDHRY